MALFVPQIHYSMTWLNSLNKNLFPIAVPVKDFLLSIPMEPFRRVV